MRIGGTVTVTAPKLLKRLGLLGLWRTVCSDRRSAPQTGGHDWLSWQFLDVTDIGGTLALLWDRTLAAVSFTMAE